MPRGTVQFLIGLSVATILLTLCSMPISRYDFCAAPDAVTISDIVGVWTAHYDNHWIEDVEWTGQQYVNGVETITFFADGTYTHLFKNETYQYNGEPSPWSLDTVAPDAPKLKMEKMRFFAAGETFAEQADELFLRPELGDILYIYQERNIEPERVYYPSSGFVYLYFRRCGFSLVLQQMTFFGRDPDNVAPASPMFYRE